MQCAIGLTIATALLCAPEYSAGQAAHEVVRWSVAPIAADEVADVPRAFRLYADMPQVVLALALTNDTANNMVVDQTAFQNALQVTVRLDGEVPVHVNWRPEVVLGDGSKVASAPPTLELAPQEFISWRLTLERTDGLPLTSRSYLLTFDVPPASSGVRTLEGTPWKSQLPIGPTQLLLVIRPPSSQAERGRMHAIAAAYAEQAGDLQAAIDELTQHLAIDPGNLRTKERIGHLSLRLGRYDEAVRLFEQVISQAAVDRVLLRVLAVAYVGSGDESNAVRVLRMLGLSEQEVSAEISAARQAVRR